MVRINKILTALTVCIALVGYLPLQPYLDPFARFFFPAALIVGLFLERRGGRGLSGRILTPVSVLLFLYLASGFSMSAVVQVTANLLVVFLGIRMLGEKSGRNYLQVFALSLFCLAASSLYNLSALFLVYLLILLLLLAVSLVVLTFHSHDPQIALQRIEMKRVFTVSSLMPLASLPIILVLFVLLPRTQYPLWDFLDRSASKKVTGMSETVKPGGSSTVAEAKNVVLRAMTRKVPDDLLYWRGIVLNAFKGDTWVRSEEPRERVGGRRHGESVHQEIYPEPSQVPYLLALNVPRAVTGLRYSDSGDFVYHLPRPLDKRVKYEVDSVLSGVIPAKEIDRDFYLALPQTVSARVRAKALEFSRPELSAADKLRRVEGFFRGQRLSYATTGLPVGKDPIDDFLFGKRKGHCELFASACATLLRLSGVPARLVGGYRGGTYSDVGGYYLVTEDMAHVWVEAFIEGRGWVSVDPSAWSSGFAPNDSAAKRLRMYADALGFYWNKAVITYNLDKQIALVRAAGGKARSLRMPPGLWKPVLGVALTLLSLGALVAMYLRGPRSREERLLQRFLRTVRKVYPSAVSGDVGLFDLAQRTGDPKVNEFAEIYGRSVYRDQRLRREEFLRLKEIIRAMREHPA